MATDATNLVKQRVWYGTTSELRWMIQEGQLMVMKRNLFVEHAANRYLVKMRTPPICLLTFEVYILYYIKKPWRPKKQAQGLHLAHTGIISNLLYKVLSSMAYIMIQRVYRLNNWTMPSHTLLRICNLITNTVDKPGLKLWLLN